MADKVINIYADSDRTFLIYLTYVDLDPVSATFGKVVPLTTGSPIAFLDVATGATVTADPDLASETMVHWKKGLWLVPFNGAKITRSKMDTFFAATPPKLIVIKTGDQRAYYPLVYVPDQKMVVAAA